MANKANTNSKKIASGTVKTDANGVEYISLADTVKELGYFPMYTRRLVQEGKLAGKKDAAGRWWVSKQAVAARKEQAAARQAMLASDTELI